MKKLLSKFKKYTFWVGFVGVFVLFLQNLARALGYDIDTTNIESAIMSFCGVLVVLGIVSKDENTSQTISQTSQDVTKEPELNVIPEQVDTFKFVEEPKKKEDIIDILGNELVDNLSEIVVEKSDDLENAFTADVKTNAVVTIDKQNVDNDETESVNHDDTFRDQVCDQVDKQIVGQFDTEKQCETNENIDLEECCMQCIYRQKYMHDNSESCVCFGEQSAYECASSTDCDCIAVSDNESEQKVVYDPTYMPLG